MECEGPIMCYLKAFELLLGVFCNRRTESGEMYFFYAKLLLPILNSWIKEFVWPCPKENTTTFPELYQTAIKNAFFFADSSHFFSSVPFKLISCNLGLVIGTNSRGWRLSRCFLYHACLPTRPAAPL